jgi:hypothetical protein
VAEAVTWAVAAATAAVVVDTTRNCGFPKKGLVCFGRRAFLLCWVSDRLILYHARVPPVSILRPGKA